jgi:hypothetical protein
LYCILIVHASRPRKNLPYLDNCDIGREEKMVIIRALYPVAEAVSDLAWGVHPMQLVSGEDPKVLSDAIMAAIRDDPTIEGG